MLSIAVMAGGCTTSVNVTPEAHPVVAHAGEDQFGQEGETLTLSATAEGGEAPYSFRWNIDVAPNDRIEAIPNADRAEIETLPLEVGRTVYRVLVTDSAGRTGRDWVTIDVGPIELGVSVAQADADGGFDASEAEAFSLTAVPSLDGEFTYVWTQSGAVAFELDHDNEATVTATPRGAGTGTLSVTATEKMSLRRASADVTVRVEAGDSFLVDVDRPDLLMLDEAASLVASITNDRVDPASVSYSWTVTAGNADVVTPDLQFTQVIGRALETIEVEVTAMATVNGVARQARRDVGLVVLDSDRPRVVMTVASDDEGVNGELTFELFADASPKTVANLVRYIDEGFYDGLLWHRVTDSPPVVQCGGFFKNDAGELEQRQATHDAVPSEAPNGLSNVVDTIAMALLSGDPDSGTTQFFINRDDNSFLDDQRFTVFGELAGGFDIVTAMEAVETDRADLAVGGSLSDVPVNDIVIAQFVRGDAAPRAAGDKRSTP